MIRVLHLCPARREFQTRRCLEYLMRDLGDEYRPTLLRIGSEDEPLSAPIGALTLHSRRGINTDIVHAWGMTALWASMLGRSPRIIFSPLPTERLPNRGPLAAWVRRAAALVVCPSQTITRRFLNIGFAPGQCQTIRPPVDLRRIKPVRNTALRAALGFDDRDDVILAPGETIRGSGHNETAWTAGILNVLDSRRRLLAWGRGDGVDVLRNFAEKLQQPNLLTLAEQRLGRSVEFEELTGVADVAVSASRATAATLPLFICMAAGLPIVSTAHTDAAQLLEDGRSALLRSRATPMMLAQCVLDLERDATMRQRLSAAARTAAEPVSLPRFLARWRAVYDAVACGEKIDVDAIAV
jgi:glycosyltransferase involved in cell wall biosynthesis